MNVGLPVQLPGLHVTVLPTAGVPETVGALVLAGPAGNTGPFTGEPVAEPLASFELCAVTTTITYLPTSPEPSV